MSLPRPQKTVRILHEVEDPDKTTAFRHDPDARIGGASGNLFFAGLPGSGRRALAQAAARALGLRSAEASSAFELAGLALASGQAVAVCNHELFTDADVVSALRASGKIFYLMHMAPALAARLGDPSRLEELAGLVERMEPYFLTAAHCITPLAATGEEMLADVLEKARL